MGHKVNTVDGREGNISLAHVRTRTIQAVIPGGKAGTYALAHVPVASTITAVRIYRAGGSAAHLQVTNDGGDVLAEPLASATDAWASTVLLRNIAVADGGSLMATLTEVAGSPGSVTVQVDLLTDVPA